jgi:hypothetical protein
MAFFFAVGLTTVSAQDVAKPKKQQFGWNKMYMDELGVSADMQAKVEAVKKENDAEIKAVRENTALTPENKKNQIKALAVKRQQGIYANLTPEQINIKKTIIARINAANKAMAEQ